jgi:uncharacterized protein (UPF0333 family)
MKIALIGLGIFSSIVIAVVLMFMSIYNYGNGVENKLEAVWKNNKVVLTNYHKKVTEVAQVPAMARDDLVKVIEAAIQGRYGADGSKAVFQMIHEQNPTIDSSMYTKIQQIIEAGRDKFETNQKEMIDVQRSYETALGSVPKGVLLKLMGFPRVDMAKYKIVTDASTEAAFETGKDEAITLRPKQ